MVAFTVDALNGPSTYSVEVIDVVQRRTCQSRPSGTGTTGDPAIGGQGSGEPVTDIALAPTGAVAFIAGPGFAFRPATTEVLWSGYEVVVSDRVGVRQLASGADIDPTSLKGSSGSASWTRSGERQTAEMDEARLRCRKRYVW